jgi:diacylglycerol kinase (ATP)
VAPVPLVILNPVAGGGRARRAADWLTRLGADVRITTRRGEAEELAAGASGHPRVIAVGGDGTVQEVVNGLLAIASPTELGLVPIGMGNDLARSLGVPRDPEAAWRLATEGPSRPIDVARATNGDGAVRWFASAGGIGFDAQVAAAMSRRRGWQSSRAGYLLTTLTELRRFSNCDVRVEIDGVVLEGQVLFIAAANGSYYGGGMRIAPDARVDDGRIDVCVVGDISRGTALRQLPNLYRGTHVRHPAVTMRSGTRVRIDGSADTRIHLDGEPFGGLPLTVEVHPAALRVVAPPASASSR